MSQPTPSDGGNRPAGADRGGLGALLLGLCAVVLSIEIMNLMMNAPALVVLAPIAGLAAIVVGIRTRRRARREDHRAPGTVGGIVLGAVGLAFSALLFSSIAVMWPEFSAFRTCTDGANTITAQRACNQTFTEGLRKRAGLPPGSLPSLDGNLPE